MSAFDAFYHLALIVTLRGKPEVIDYYTELLGQDEGPHGARSWRCAQ